LLKNTSDCVGQGLIKLNIGAKITDHEFYNLVDCIFDFKADQSLVGLALDFHFVIHPVELLVP
jgi:hypothetical protein